MTTNEPSNDIDLLMSKDPLDMSDLDIDAIIAYNRNQRAVKEAGGTRKARKAAGPSDKLDLGKLGLKPIAPKITRRI